MCCVYNHTHNTHSLDVCIFIQTSVSLGVGPWVPASPSGGCPSPTGHCQGASSPPSHTTGLAPAFLGWQCGRMCPPAGASSLSPSDNQAEAQLVPSASPTPSCPWGLACENVERAQQPLELMSSRPLATGGTGEEDVFAQAIAIHQPWCTSAGAWWPGLGQVVSLLPGVQYMIKGLGVMKMPIIIAMVTTRY